MPKSWTQREWTTPGTSLYRDKGDYDTLNALMLSKDGRQLQRAAGWTAYAALTDATALYHISLDVANNTTVFIGKKADGKLYAFTPSASNVLVDGLGTLGSIDTLNVLYWGGHFYVIKSNLKVYRGTGYTSALSEFYGDADAEAIVAHDDRIYLLTNAAIKRLNEGDDAFETFFTPINTPNFVYATSFRGYLLTISLELNGTLVFYQLTDNASFNTLAQFPGVTGANVGWGTLFTLHNDLLYFSPGYVSQPNLTYTFEIHSFNGSSIQHVATVNNISSTAAATGLLSWDGRLLFYELGSGDPATYTLYEIQGQSITTLTTLTTEASIVTPSIAVVKGGQIAVTADDTTVGYHLFNSTSALEDGYITTARLDFGLPGQQKRLEQITVTLNDAATDFKVVIKYRVDDTAAWTTATTGNNTRLTKIGGIGTGFYTLQLRIDLDDDTGDNEDIRIDAINVIYSEPNYARQSR